MHRQAAPRHTRILGFLCLSAALSSALAFVPVPSEQVNRESQIAEIRRLKLLQPQSPCGAAAPCLTDIQCSDYYGECGAGASDVRPVGC